MNEEDVMAAVNENACSGMFQCVMRKHWAAGAIVALWVTLCGGFVAEVTRDETRWASDEVVVELASATADDRAPLARALVPAALATEAEVSSAAPQAERKHCRAVEQM